MARTTGNDAGGQAGNSADNTEIIRADGQDVIKLPDADFVDNAEILRDGQDLILQAPDGSTIVIEGYFNASPAPLLQAPDGTALSPQLVESFVKTAGSEYAQMGTLNDASPIGAVKEVSGEATVTRADGSKETINVGTPVFEGDIIETSAEGAVNIVFIDETSFAVSQNAKLAIDEYVFDPASESGTSDFSVLRGLFVFTSGLIGREDPDDVTIDTPMGSIGIRGTIIAGNMATGEITVMEGAIVMRGFNGNEITLAEQFETGRFDPATGDVVYVGATDANTFTNSFNSIKSVTPGFFSSLENGNDDGGDAGNDSGTTGGQNEGGENSQQQTAPAGADQGAAEPPAPEMMITDTSFDGGNDVGFDTSAGTVPDSGATGPVTSNTAPATESTAPTATQPAAPPPTAASDNTTPPPPPVNNNPQPPANVASPVFGNPGTTFSIGELQGLGVAVGGGTVIATDADGTNPTYSITGGNTGNAFSIDAGGVIRVNAPLDYETTSTYNLTIEASDGAHTTTATYTVNIVNANDAPTGAATISGTLAENQTLTAASTIADADGMGVLSYQWQHSADGITWSNIGTNNANYTLVDADVGAKIRVNISYTDGLGTSESVTSSMTGTVGNVNDAPTGGVTIGGTLTENQVLTANSTIADDDGMGTLNYQWERSTDGGTTWSNVGANNANYTLGDNDAGAKIRVTVSYTDAHGTTESVTSGMTGTIGNVNDAPTGAVTISGTLAENQTLTAASTVADADGMGAPSYQWERSTDGGTTWSNVGTNSINYALGDSDVGATIRVTVSYTDGFGNPETVGSSMFGPVGNVNDAPTGTPTINGTLAEDQTLTASTTGIADADGLATFHYQWLRSTDSGTTWSNVGTDSASYGLGDADVGALIKVTVTYTDAHGTAESVTSAPTAAINNINDAPTTTNTTQSTAEDAPVVLTLGDFGTYGDIEGDALASVKITTLPGNGLLQYYNGSAWVSVAANAVISASDINDGFLRFAPDADENGSNYANIGFQVSDGTDFSATHTLTIDVTAINDAPVLDNTGNPALTSIAEGAASPAGNTVASIVINGSVTDIDGAPVEGIAITNIPTMNGTWQYSLNGGGTWTNMNALGLSNSNALLLGPTDMLRFVPNALYSGTEQISYRAWDMSSGTAGAQENTTVNGGTTPFSTAVETADMTVTGTNNAPTLDLDSGSGGDDYATSLDENDPGIAIGGMVGVSDSDDANMESATITLTNAQDGMLEFLSHPSGNTSWNGISISGSGTHSITLSGTATLAMYNAIIQAIVYNNISDSPDTTNRTIQVKVNDGSVDSNIATATITVTEAVDDDDTFASVMGNTMIAADGGDDTFLSAAADGDDSFTGGDGNDTFMTVNGDGDDTLMGDGDNDTYDAGAVTNDMTYSLNSAGDGSAVQAVSGDADFFTSIEKFTGGTGADHFQILASDFAYDLDGGGGSDMLDFSALADGVTIDMDQLQADIDGGETIGFQNIETFIGSDGDDEFMISASETIDRTYYGGAGNDTYSAVNWPSSINVNLISNTVGHGALVDTVSGIETFIGSNGNDSFRGNSNANTFNGGLGSDTFYYSAGADNLSGGGGADLFDAMTTGNSITVDFTNGEMFDGTDTSMFSGIETFQMGTGNDTFVVDSSTLSIVYNFSGGGGTDTVDYSALGAGDAITALSLAAGGAGTVTIGGGNTDTLTGIENVIGTQGADTINSGSDTAQNVIHGHDGNDILSGGAGDRLFGDQGNDSLMYSMAPGQSFELDGGDGTDIIEFSVPLNMTANGNAQIVRGGTGTDTLNFWGGGAITIAADGGEDRIEQVETYDFRGNALVDNITIDFRNFMVGGNDGNTLLIKVADTDMLDFDFSAAGGGWNLSTSGASWQEFTNSGMTVRIESVTSMANVTVTGAGMPVTGLNLNALAAVDGLKITTTAGSGIGFGNSIAAFDKNNDGFSDLVITRDTNGVPGQVNFLMGGAALANTTMGSLASTGNLLAGGSPNNNNMQVAGGGDFNGDGFLDYIVSADGAGANGQAQIVDGQSGAVMLEIEGLSLAQLGHSIAFAGDIDGDGFDDVIIGAPNTNSSDGGAYVLFGKQMPVGPTEIVDIAQIENPHHTGNSGLGFAALDVASSGNYTYVLVYTGAPNGGKIQIYDNNNSGGSSVGTLIENNVITSLSGYTGASGSSIPLSNASSIMIHGQYMYILSGDAGGGFGQITILNIANPTAPTFAGLYKNITLAYATAMDISNGTLTVVTENDGTGTAGEIIKFPLNANGTLGTAMGPTAHTGLAGASDVAIFGTHAYVMTTSGIRAVDISAAPAIGTNFPLANAHSLYVDKQSGLLFVVAGTSPGTLTVFDLNTDATGLAANHTISNAAIANATDVIVQDGIAYVTTAQGVIMVDVHNPAAMTLRSNIDATVTADNNAVAITIDDDGVLHVVSGGGTNNLTSYDLKPSGMALDNALTDLLGQNVASAGDINDDGFDDFLVSMPGTAGLGQVALILGGEQNLRNLDLNNPSTFINITNADITLPPDGNMLPVFGIGDMDGNGSSDIAIVETDSNRVRIFYGESMLSPGARNISTANITIQAAANVEIIGAAAAGDFNGDGYDDFIVGMRNTTGNGDVVNFYVVYGNGGDNAIDDADLHNPNKAFMMTYQIPDAVGASADNDPDNFQFIISSAGDINGDGFADIAIGMPDLDKTNDSVNDDRDGEVMVVYGRPDSASIHHDGAVGTSISGHTEQYLLGEGGNDIIQSGVAGQVLDGGLGNDTLISMHNGITLLGGAGDDTIRLSAGGYEFTKIDGGGGSDTLELVGTNSLLDLTAIGGEKVANIEKIMMSGNQTLVLGLNDIFDMMEGATDNIAKISGTGSNNTVVIELPDFGFGVGTLADNNPGTATTGVGEGYLDGFSVATAGSGASSGYKLFDFGAGYHLWISDSLITNGHVVLSGRENTVVTDGSAYDSDGTTNGTVLANNVNQTLLGTASNNTLDDNFNTGAAMFGFEGNDTFIVHNGNFSMINGGAGSDKIKISGNADLQGFAAHEISGVEELEIASNYTLTLSRENIMNLLASSNANTLTIDALTANGTFSLDVAGSGSGNVSTTQFASALGWTDAGTQAWSDVTSGTAHKFTNGSATLYIDQALFSNNNVETV